MLPASPILQALESPASVTCIHPIGKSLGAAKTSESQVRRDEVLWRGNHVPLGLV